MNAFANPEDAVLYEYPEFPAPVRQQEDFSGMEGLGSGSFTDFEHSQNETNEKVVSVVQTAVLQDFKEVIPQA